jgi:hypothetical protein
LYYYEKLDSARNTVICAVLEDVAAEVLTERN